jgi:hypothetical protein
LSVDIFVVSEVGIIADGNIEYFCDCRFCVFCGIWKDADVGLGLRNDLNAEKVGGRYVRGLSNSAYLIIVPSSRILQGQNNTNVQDDSTSSSE